MNYLGFVFFDSRLKMAEAYIYLYIGMVLHGKRAGDHIVNRRCGGSDGVILVVCMVGASRN